MRCVECGARVRSAVQQVGAACTSVRLSRCESCGQIADKYFELEIVLVLLDMLLQRASAYRHLLCNCTWHPAQKTRRDRLLMCSIILLLCEPFLKAMQAGSHIVVKGTTQLSGATHRSEHVNPAAIMSDLTFSLGSCVTGFLIFCASAIGATAIILRDEQVNRMSLLLMRNLPIYNARMRNLYCLGFVSCI